MVLWWAVPRLETEPSAIIPGEKGRKRGGGACEWGMGRGWLASILGAETCYSMRFAGGGTWGSIIDRTNGTYDFGWPPSPTTLAHSWLTRPVSQAELSFGR